MSHLAVASSVDEFDGKDLARVNIVDPCTRTYDSIGKDYETCKVELKEGNNEQYKEKDFRLSVAEEIYTGYVSQQNDLPWMREIGNIEFIARTLEIASDRSPDKNWAKITIYKEDYEAHLLGFDDKSPAEVYNVGYYYYGLKLEDASAQNTNAVVMFPDFDTLLNYMRDTGNNEGQWDNLKNNAIAFVEQVNKQYPGRVNTEEVLVYIGGTEFANLVISNNGFEVSSSWPDMVNDGYCFSLSSTAVRTYYDLAGIRNILSDSEEVATEIKSFAQANGKDMEDRSIGEIEAELDIHLGGWLITDSDSSWNHRAMPADINFFASWYFVDCIFDVS